MRLSPGLLATVAVLCLAAGTGRSQYVEDLVDVGGGWVGSLAYNSREDVLHGARGDRILFAISCDSNKVVASLLVSGAFAVAYDSSDNKAYCSYGEFRGHLN
jgi:hypothetical protein